MTWLKRKQDAHDCEIPYLDPSDIGDLWLCDICNRVWEQVPYQQYRNYAFDRYTTFPSGNKQFGRIKEARVESRTDGWTVERNITPEWARWEDK